MMPARRSAGLLRAAVAATLATVLAGAPVGGAIAQGGRVAIVRDAEVESLLKDYATPILRAAGLNTANARIVLVNDRSFNAFVANGQKIFINVGALIEAETPNEIIGVIAHEAGHIAGGHLARLRQQIATAQILSVVGLLLGAGAVAGAATSGDRVGNSGTGVAGVFAGGQELVMRNLLAYQRSEEQAADQSAIRYLTATRQSPRGMLTTFRRFADSGLFRSSALDPYLLSHPLPTERVAQLETLAKASPHFDARDPPALQARHDMMRAKLVGFVDRPESVLRRYKPGDNSVPARYARAISAYRHARSTEALAAVEALIRERPTFAYFHELKGQILLESGRAREAVGPLRRAASLDAAAVPIKVMLGQALVATGDPKSLDEAIRLLVNATAREPDNGDAFQQLATAYGRKGNIGQAELAAAQAYFLSGDLRNAQTQASRALAKLPPGSPGYLKAEDIVNYRPSSSN
jgi:predicted Zn-dependent protease